MYQAVVEEIDMLMQECRQELKGMRPMYKWHCLTAHFKAMRIYTSRLPNNSAERRLRQTQEISLAKSLMKLAEDYQMTQSKVKAEQQTKLRRQYKLGNDLLFHRNIQISIFVL